VSPNSQLLRCLLTCGTCGLAMHGVVRPSAGGPRHYYRCAGKDCVHTARAVPCPRAQIEGDQLERAVWDHVRALLANPEQLLAQYRRMAAGADPQSQREQTTDRQVQARLDRLARTDRRLLDAYQADVISLDEFANDADN
jgi:site-specific DNA recombinase